MEVMKGFLEAIKTYTYEVLAMLLPGAALLSFAHVYCGVNMDAISPANAWGFLGASYLISLAMQGLWAAAVHKLIKGGALPYDASLKALDEGARAVYKKKKRGEPPQDREAFLSYCIDALGEKINVYDKFTALRDMAKGLALAAAFACAHFSLGLLGGPQRPWPELLVSLALLAGFLQRTRSFEKMRLTLCYSIYASKG